MTNAAPTTSNSTHNTNEDTGYVLSASDFNFVDSDGGDTLQAVQITVLPAGALRLKGVHVTIDQVISIADINAGYLVFTPPANLNGTEYLTFQFKVSDGKAWSDSEAAFTLDVAAVNDAPVFSLGAGKLTTAIGSWNDGKSVKVLADGKILMGGSSYSGSYTDFSLVRFNSDGSLDTSFSEDGKLMTSIGSNYDTATSMTVQTDGKILLAGYSLVDSNTHFSLVRYNSDGSLDTSFSEDGKLITSISSGSSAARSVTLQADGKILLGGHSYDGSTLDFALVRYNSDGSLDTTFSTDGKLTTGIGSNFERADSVTVQADGKILLGGTTFDGSNAKFALMRYNSDGSLDTSFSDDGKLTTAIGVNGAGANSMTLQADGKILLAGYSTSGSYSEFALVRYNSDGSLDTSFSDDGILTTAIINLNSAQANSVTVQANGKILLGGYAWNGNSNEFVLVRYNSDGSLDTSFSTDGMLSTIVGGSSDQAYSVTVQADGKILLGGTSDSDFALVRYNSDGSLDTSFNPSKALFTLSGSAVVLDADVRITDIEFYATGNYAGSSLSLSRQGGANPQDIFAGSGSLQLSDGSVIVDSINIGKLLNVGGSLNVSFNANATKEFVNSALQQITYANTGTTPGSAEIIWLFNDGSGAGNAIVQGSTLVTLMPANVAPTLGGTQTGQAITSAQRIQPFKTISVTDPDVGALETATITLDNPLKGSFTANSMALAGFYTNDGGVSYVHDAVSPAAMQAAIRALVFQPNPSRLALNTSETTTFTIAVQDQLGGTATNSTTTVITSSVNMAPTNILLSDAFVAQSEGANATVGLLSATDNNVGDTHTFTLMTPNAGNDNAKFSIVGNSLKVINPGSMTEKDYYVTVQATDANGLSFTKKLTIGLEDDIAPFISSIETLRSPRPTVTTGSYIVKFNENVTGVSLDDFFLSSGSGATAHLSSIVALSGSAYRVYIDQILGTGSLNLNLKTSGTGIADLFGNSLPGAFPPAPQQAPLIAVDNEIIDFVATNDLLIGVQTNQQVFAM